MAPVGASIAAQAREVDMTSLADVKAAFAEARGEKPKQKRKRVKRTFIRTRAVSSTEGLDVHIGMRIRCPDSDGRMHWGTKASHHKKFAKAVEGAERPLAVKRIVFVRWSPRLLDKGDNLNYAFKWLRDAACKWLGLPNDGPMCGVEFEYEQHPQVQPSAYGVTIRFR